jgi:hypothetical protein
VRPEGSNLRPADYEPTGLAFQLTDKYDIRWAAKLIVLRLCSPEASSLLPRRHKALELLEPVLDEDELGDGFRRPVLSSHHQE